MRRRDDGGEGHWGGTAATQSRHLPRFRGFAPEKSIFARMAPGKPLIIRGYMERMRAKPAVVKTYPVPAGSFRSLDSPRHVFTADPANEGRQDAQLLERRREPAS